MLCAGWPLDCSSVFMMRKVRLGWWWVIIFVTEASACQFLVAKMIHADFAMDLITIHSILSGWFDKPNHILAKNLFTSLLIGNLASQCPLLCLQFRKRHLSFPLQCFFANFFCEAVTTHWVKQISQFDESCAWSNITWHSALPFLSALCPSLKIGSFCHHVAHDTWIIFSKSESSPSHLKDWCPEREVWAANKKGTHTQPVNKFSNLQGEKSSSNKISRHQELKICLWTALATQPWLTSSGVWSEKCNSVNQQLKVMRT